MQMMMMMTFLCVLVCKMLFFATYCIFCVYANNSTIIKFNVLLFIGENKLLDKMSIANGYWEVDLEKMTLFFDLKIIGNPDTKI